MIKHSRASFQIKIRFRENAQWEQWALISSDRHLDNTKSNRELQIHHLEEVKERNAFVVDIGDLFDAMEGKFDRRGHKEGIRLENLKDNYFDSLVESAADFFEPYARYFAICGEGNHETAITKHHEISLIDRFVTLMRLKGSPVQKAGYGGFVSFTFTPERGPENSIGSGGTTRIVLRFQHGGGGGGTITKGMIQASRRAMMFRDADIVMSGHVHEHWMTPFVQAGVNRDYSIYQTEQLHICTPTYKNEFEDGHGGYHIEKERGPRPLGAVWLRFYWCRREQRVRFEALRAQ